MMFGSYNTWFYIAFLILVWYRTCPVAAQATNRCYNCRYGSDYCDVDNRCLFGCEPGFLGGNCSLTCSIRNCLECIQLPTTQEQCVMCTGNVYGPLCNINCNHNCRGLASTSRSICDHQGKCIYGCELGYHGDKCDEVECNYANCGTCGVQWNGHVYCERCIDGYYYHVEKGCIQCSETCLTPYDCDPHSGVCRNGCRPGMFGAQCTNYCNIENCNDCYTPVHDMGVLCRNCTSGLRPSYNQKECILCGSECIGCDSATGYCLACGEGLFGNKCQYRCSIAGCKQCYFDTSVRKPACAVCKEGYFQMYDRVTYRNICQNCSDTCKDGLCNNSTGDCFSCATGYYGREAMVKGDSCRFRCSEHCVSDDCEDTGACTCKPGWFDMRCTRNCPVKCYSCIGYENGKCQSCEHGYYGDACDKHCPTTCESRSSTALPTCDQASGHCDFGCIAGYYGDWCNETCSAGCDGGSCHKVSGKCLAGCTTYWYGERCDMRCSGNCVADGITSINRPCDVITGKCLQGCMDNYYGDKCDKICNYKCREQKCFQDTGTCRFGCMNGWMGRNCSEQCYQNCPDECTNCVEHYCDEKTRDCLQGCVSGFYGPKCQNNCSPNCLDRNCDDYTGTCHQCISGYYGPSCTLECSPRCRDGVCNKDSGECDGCVEDSYGYRCSLKCPANCFTRKCKQDTGQCEDGCIAGFFEKQCDKECWDGWYGKDCSSRCGHCLDGSPCVKSDGRCISGCDVGYGGDKCGYAMSQSGPVVYDQQRVAVIAGVSVAVLLVLAIVITVGILCYCRSKRARKAKREEPSVVFTTDHNSVQVVQPGTSIILNESDVSLHQVESHLLGSREPEIRCTGIVAHRDYYILHRGTVLKHGEREDAYIKVLLLNETEEKQTHLSWLKNEVKILEMCLTHPNIICLLTVEQKPDRYLVALSNCMQNNLVPYLHEINHSDDDEVHHFYHHQLMQFAIDIIDALCFLHRQQIIHRYIRARSVYLSDNLVAKVGEFDFAIIYNEDDITADVGTGRRDLPSTYSCWLAPEALISCKYSIKSDIWSYGILLWEIFTLSQHPYNRLEGNKLQRAIVDGQRPPKPGLASLFMYRLMKSCWRHSPEDRPTAESVLCQLTETEGDCDGSEQIVIQV